MKKKATLKNRIDLVGYAKRIIDTMERKDISLSELSSRTGFSEDCILTHVQLHDCGGIKISDIWKMARGLGVDVVWLMMG